MPKQKVVDWILLIAGVAVITALLGLVMTAEGQTTGQGYSDSDAPPYRSAPVVPLRTGPDPCATWPQPAYCAPRPWYELSILIPREQQYQIVQQALPRLLPALTQGLALGQPSYPDWVAQPPVYPSGPGRRCYEVNSGYPVEIPCPTFDRARRSINRPVRRLQRQTRRGRGRR